MKERILSYLSHIPQIGERVFVAPGAWVIGNVVLGNHTSIWFNTVLRGDVNVIQVGENTNVQDLSMLHNTERSPLIIGANVSIGHSVTLHGCTINDSCLIGMGATVLDDAIIGKNSLVAANSLVPPKKVFPEGVMIMGNPAKVVRELTPEEKHMVANHYKAYLGYKEIYLKDKTFTL
ncbi:MAG: gamma carbonic anhydrase family protein [Bacteriovoracaceae bacterium]|nr:gamma carbonic anhydrase family protein [Bacteriovoracaceae bacterium]